jgi:START domain
MKIIRGQLTITGYRPVSRQVIPKCFLLTICFACLMLFLQAQDDWKLKMDKEGIKIYSRPCASSAIDALKVSCVLEATLSQITAVLLDVKNQDQWFYHTKSKILLDISPSELYYYAELYFPFPFSNRDFVEHLKLSQDSVSKIIIMDVQNVPDYISTKKDFIRVIQSACNWTIKPIGKNQIIIEFTLFADPAGSIPSWLVNRFSLYGPYETFKKLKNYIRSPEYMDVKFPFIKNY